MMPPSPTFRPPVALGCTLALAAIGVVVFAVVLGVVFLDSGTANGSATLDPLASYPKGTITTLLERRLFVVRLPAGQILALSTSYLEGGARRCSVATIAPEDPTLPTAIERTKFALNPQVAGTTTLLRESCDGRLFDISGLSLDGIAGRNLDRYVVTLDGAGRVVVNTSKRNCTVRGDERFTPVPCN